MNIGFTCGTFDLLHAGHVAMLAECRTYCDKLIVGLQTDPTIDRLTKNKPVQTTLERYIQLSGIKFVDEIIPYDTEQDLCNIFATMSRINMRFVGEEYKGLQLTGEDICDMNNIKIIYTSRRHTYSSSELRQRACKDVIHRSVLY